MKIDDANLTSYLVEHLQPLTEADPNLLAKYVVALLKNNKPKKDLQMLCVDKLFDFLGEESKAFVVNLFHALEDGAIATLEDERDTKVADDATTVPATMAATMVAKVMLSGDNTEPRTSSQSEKFSNANISGFSDHEEEGTDDDDDRNHKHRRRASRSRSLDRDTQDGSLRKRNRPAINGQPMYDDSHPTAEVNRGSNIIYIEKDGPPKRRSSRDNVYGGPSRLGGEGNQRGVSRGASIFRGDGLGFRFEHQNGLSRGVLGRGRGATTASWGAREQRTASLDGSDFNLSILPPGPPTNLFSGRSTSSRGNPPHSPWAGYGHFAGMINGALDQTLPLNAGMQGSRGVPINAALGVGVNIGMGMTLGRPRCLDFEERGYCLRGDLCPMEHGANRIVVEDVQSLSKFNLPVALPSGRGMELGSVSVSTSSLAPYSSNHGLSSIAMRETNMPSLDEPSLSKGTLTTSASAEPDLYDPDQPLWNKEQPAAVADGIRRLPSFRKGLEGNEWESTALEHHRGRSPDDGRYRKSSTTSAGPSVWNRIGRIERGDIKAESITRPANISVESLQRSKAPKRELVEDHEPQSMSDKWANNLDERDEKTIRSSNVKVGVNNSPEREVGLHPTEKTGYSSRRGQSMGPGNERAQRTLYVGCIPSNNNRKELLMVHFQKFGEIMDIRIPSQGDRAFVQFSRRGDAEAALLSPEAVMGNRFIRLSWAKRDSIQVSSAEGNTGLTSNGRSMSTGTGGAQGLVNETSSMKGKRQASAVSTTSESNAFKSAGKSGGSNVQPSSSTVSQKELEHMKEELRRKQEELAQKRDDFRRKLERLSKQSSGVAAELEGDQSSNSLSSALKAEIKGDQPSNKQLNPEKPEAAINNQSSVSPATVEKGVLSTDQPASGLVKDPLKQPLGLAQTSSGSITQPSPRGLRGHSPWPGATGTGFVGSSQWGPLRYKLDNRTTVFRILPPFPDGLLDVSTLKEHFSCFGDLPNVEVEVEVEDVYQKVEANLTGKHAFRATFCTRSAAEQAFIQGRWYQGTSLNFSWVNPPSSATVGAISTGNVHVEGMNDNPRHSCSGAVEKGPEDTKSSKIQGSIAGNGSQVEDGLSVGKGADNVLQPGWAQVPGGGHCPQLETNSKVDAADVDGGSGLWRVATSM